MCQHHYPAQRYIMVDDKPGILAAMKEVWGARLDDGLSATRPLCARKPEHGFTATADMTVEHIAELIHCSYSDFSLSA